jgi:UDP-galactopyranose mutase
MSDDSWIDELFDGKPSELTYSQWLTIECNIDLTSFTTQMKSDILNRINDLTEEEAELIITKIYENRYEKDTQKQWKKMLRDGVFD